MYLRHTLRTVELTQDWKLRLRARLFWESRLVKNVHQAIIQGMKALSRDASVAMSNWENIFLQTRHQSYLSFFKKTSTSSLKKKKKKNFY